MWKTVSLPYSQYLDICLQKQLPGEEKEVTAVITEFNYYKDLYETINSIQFNN